MSVNSTNWVKVYDIEINWYLSIVEVAPQIKERFRRQPVADSVRAHPVCREPLPSTLVPSAVPSSALQELCS